MFHVGPSERLEGWPDAMVGVACAACPRRGRYRKATLAARHGATIALPMLVRKIAADCAKGRLCGAHLVRLPPPPDGTPPDRTVVALPPRRLLTVGELRKQLVRYAPDMPLVVARPGGRFALARGTSVVAIDMRPFRGVRNGQPVLVIEAEE